MAESNFPQATITNGLITAKIFLPDHETGYYRSTRFDWSGNIPSLEYKGHQFFGKWFDEYRPEIHDVIMGPVEDFQPLGYDEKAPGEHFVKIGIGVLKKPDNAPYAFARLYPIVNKGIWDCTTDKDRIHFEHEINDTEYSYKYGKTIRLAEGKPELIITHTLYNTGEKSIETTVYDHNFFMMDSQPVGPGYTVSFPFKLEGDGIGVEKLAKLRANEISYVRNVEKGEEVFCPSITGFGSDASDYEIRIRNSATGQSVRITCDQPLVKLAFWCCHATLCPEPYIAIKATPGEAASWTLRYEFFVTDVTK